MLHRNAFASGVDPASLVAVLRARVVACFSAFVVTVGAAPLALHLPAAHAQDSGPDFLQVIGLAEGEYLALRAGPGEGFEEIAQIPFDSTGLANLGCEGGLTFAEWTEATPEEREAAAANRWCEVDFGGTVGWAAGRFLGEATSNIGNASIDGTLVDRWDLVASSFGGGRGNAWIAFADDGSVVGFSGCNSFNTNANSTAQELAFGPVTTTLLLCGDGAVDAQERFLFSMLEIPLSYAFTGDLLLLRSEFEEDLLVFARNLLTGAQWNLTTITDRDVAEANAWIRIGLDGALTGRTGCNVVQGRTTQAGDRFDVAGLTMTRAACPGPNLAGVETALLELLEGPIRFVIETTELVLTGNGGAQFRFNRAPE